MTAATYGAEPPGSSGPDVPSPARILSYWQGGTAHYAADRAVAAQVEALFPQVRQIARDSCQFAARTVAYAAGVGVSQFVALERGLQPPPAVHEVARQIRRGAAVAYIEHDLETVDELGDLYAGEAGIAVVHADLCDSGAVLAGPGVAGVIDLAGPVCVLASAVPRYLTPGPAIRAIAGYAELLASGSYLAVCVPRVPDLLAWEELAGVYGPAVGRSYTARMLGRLLAGLELVPPGVTTAAGFRPGWGDGPGIPAGVPCAIAAIGRVP